MARIGILGGTFDPIHHGHLAVAEDARLSLGLHQVVFVPAAQQPLKQPGSSAPAVDRLAMVHLACQSNPAFEVSPIEIERAGMSYTATTLEQLQTRYDAELFSILGADALMDLPKWHRALELPLLANFVAVSRPGTQIDIEPLIHAIPTLDGRLQLLEGPRLEISSTELRHRAAAKRSLRYLVPDAVAEYIDKNQLYS